MVQSASQGTVGGCPNCRVSSITGIWSDCHLTGYYLCRLEIWKTSSQPVGSSWPFCASQSDCYAVMSCERRNAQTAEHPSNKLDTTTHGERRPTE